MVSQTMLAVQSPSAALPTARHSGLPAQHSSLCLPAYEHTAGRLAAMNGSACSRSCAQTRLMPVCSQRYMPMRRQGALTAFTTSSGCSVATSSARLHLSTTQRAFSVLCHVSSSSADSGASQYSSGSASPSDSMISSGGTSAGISSCTGRRPRGRPRKPPETAMQGSQSDLSQGDAAFAMGRGRGRPRKSSEALTRDTPATATAGEPDVVALPEKQGSPAKTAASRRVGVKRSSKKAASTTQPRAGTVSASDTAECHVHSSKLISSAGSSSNCSVGSSSGGSVGKPSGEVIKLGPHALKSKAAAKAFVSGLLKDLPTGRVKDPDALLVLHDLFRRHRDYEKRTANGLRGFAVRRDPVKGRQRCFYAVDSTGQEQDFSYIKCIGGHKESRLLTAAFRSAIEDQLLAFKRAAYARKARITCPLTGIQLADDWKTIVDYKSDVPGNTLKDLKERFMRELGLTAADICIEDKAFVDRDLCAAWQEFHAEHADLRMVRRSAKLRG